MLSGPVDSQLDVSQEMLVMKLFVLGSRGSPWPLQSVALRFEEARGWMAVMAPSKEEQIRIRTDQSSWIKTYAGPILRSDSICFMFLKLGGPCNRSRA